MPGLRGEQPHHLLILPAWCSFPSSGPLLCSGWTRPGPQHKPFTSMMSTSMWLTPGLGPVSAHLSHGLLDQPAQPGASHPETHLSGCWGQRPLLASCPLLAQTGDRPGSSGPLSSSPTFSQVAPSEHFPPRRPSAFPFCRFPRTLLQSSLGHSLCRLQAIRSHQPSHLLLPEDLSERVTGQLPREVPSHVCTWSHTQTHSHTPPLTPHTHPSTEARRCLPATRALQTG